MPSSSAETTPTSEAPPPRRRAEALWGGPKVAFAAILALAAALRVVGADYAHPFALFSPDGARLFATGFNSNALAVFDRDSASGLLTEVQVINRDVNTGLHLFADGSFWSFMVGAKRYF